MVVTVSVLWLIFFFLQIIQNCQLLVSSPLLHSHFQRRLVDDHSGFISIDCGSTTDSYFEKTTGLYYTYDKKYINTGTNIVLPQPNQNYPTLPGFVDLGKTIRSFPKGRKNCYRLSPVKPYKKYLIRAQFIYSLNSSLPIFDVYIGVNLWFTLKDSKAIAEIIHVATSTSIDVCLINTNQGDPFISALELRPLDNSSYLAASPQLSLTVRYREDSGGSVASSSGPYMVKDDAYNRQWYMYHECDSTTITTTESFDGSQTDPFKVPTSVLSTALEKTDTTPNLTISQRMNVRAAKVYYYWHFAELELLDSNDTREFTILVPQDPGYTFGPIRPKYLHVTTVSSPRISYDGQMNFSFTLTKTSKSTLYPILNAYEVYFALDLPVSPTIQEDAYAIKEIKDKYAVTRLWQGDPCLPFGYQWDGLNCSYDGNNPPRITSLSLSSSNLNGELPPYLSNLTSLTYLNLSNNVFTGEIPEFLAHLPSLTAIDLSGNNLTGPVPHQLAEKASNNSIKLRLVGNPNVCKSYRCEKSVTIKKRRLFIVPVVACVVSVSFIAIILIIFLKFKRTKKKVDGAIKLKNKQFKSPDIVRITDSYRKVLGKGGFGTVYYGVLEDGTEVAVKVLNHTSSTINVKRFCAEAELLTRTHHVNLVSLVGYCNERENMALVFKYMSCGDLHSQLSEKNENPLSWQERLQISVDAAQGLEYLHSGCRPPIIHRDIKPANILLDKTGHAKIADFGLSRFSTTDSQGIVKTGRAGTHGYLDPECYQLISTFSEKSDVYAFGVVMLQLLTGQPILVKNTNYESDEYDIAHIVVWVSLKVESGDILAIIDKRMQGDSIVDSAWMFLEIAMECVKPKGNERPRMSEVVAGLKVCYSSAGFREGDAPVNVDKGKFHSMGSSRALDSNSHVSLPSAR